MLRLMGFALAGIALLLSVPAATQHEIQQPKDKWQQPKEIQKPRDIWQPPGAIQVPKGIQAIRTEEEKCTRRFVIGAETLTALAPLLPKAGPHPAMVKGHTDAKGSAAYNQTLSEKRAWTVRDWLAVRGALPITTPIQGWGERRPIAPNLKPDGSDDPAGRQKNRRVEVTLDLCSPK